MQKFRGPGRSLAASAVLLTCGCSEGGTTGGAGADASTDAPVTTSSGNTLGNAGSGTSTLAGNSNNGGSGGLPTTSGDAAVGSSSTSADGGASNSEGTVALANSSSSGSTADGGGASNSGGSGGSGGTSPVDPSAPLTPVAFFPSKGRTEACADASVSIRFNRTPILQSGGKLQIHEASGEIFDGVTSSLQDDLYFSDLVPRSSGGETFDSDALDVVYDTVVFQPKGKLDYGKTYYVTIDEGMITDSDGTSFAVQESDGWTFTVREQEPASADAYVLAADGSGDYCSLEGVLEALPDAAEAPRVITVRKGVYPGIVRMSESNVHFRGEGTDTSIFSHKNRPP